MLLALTFYLSYLFFNNWTISSEIIFLSIIVSSLMLIAFFLSFIFSFLDSIMRKPTKKINDVLLKGNFVLVLNPIYLKVHT